MGSCSLNPSKRMKPFVIAPFLRCNTEFLSPKFADCMNASLVEPKSPGLVFGWGLSVKGGAGQDGGVRLVVRVADRCVADEFDLFGAGGFFKLLARVIVGWMHPDFAGVAE